MSLLRSPSPCSKAGNCPLLALPTFQHCSVLLLCSSANARFASCRKDKGRQRCDLRELGHDEVLLQPAAVLPSAQTGRRSEMHRPCTVRPVGEWCVCVTQTSKAQTQRNQTSDGLVACNCHPEHRSRHSSRQARRKSSQESGVPRVVRQRSPKQTHITEAPTLQSHRSLSQSHRVSLAGSRSAEEGGGTEPRSATARRLRAATHLFKPPISPQLESRVRPISIGKLLFVECLIARRVMR